MERRSTARHSLDLSAEVNNQPVRLVDLSVGGARVELMVRDVLRVGDAVTLTVQLRHQARRSTWNCMGRVLRQQNMASQQVIAMTLGSMHLEDPDAALAVLSRL
ncbi:MAG: PilZ domain-containing protein [Pseudomonadota bacterium]|nr:PilZ domain-containing protein [Pseudomonadota bacterium]